jgi:periplasmic protein TonB
MFAETMIETSWDQRSRRNWSTLASFALQALLLIGLLMLPLVTPNRLPFLKALPAPVSLAAYHDSPRPRASPMHPSAPAGGSINHVFMQPAYIPRHAGVGAETDIAAPNAEVGLYGRDSWTTGDRDGVFNAIGNSKNPALPSLPKPVVHPIHISQMNPGSLVHRVQPEYPALAKTARIQGQVVLAAIISQQGTIENLRVVLGPPLLVRAAIDAVSQWRYRPYILNGQPVEVETQIEVNFLLSGN